MGSIGFFLAIIIGIVLGLIGGGGTILSVPVFVYIFDIDAVTATAYSLFVVGVTSFIGSFGFVKNKLIDYRTAFLFGTPSILGILFSRRLVLPHLPEYIINRWGITLTKDMFILIMFAILMLVAAINMIKKTNAETLFKSNKPNYTLLVSQGLLVGIVTGFVGAGGGFLIVPALVMLLGIDIKKAIATSLFIISMNSLIGFATSIDKVETDWNFISIFSAISAVGVFIGIALGKRIDGRKLKPGFGWLVLVMGLYIIINELFLQ